MSKPVDGHMIAAAQRMAADAYGRASGVDAELSAYCAMRSDDEARAGNEADARSWAIKAYELGHKSVQWDVDQKRAMAYAEATERDACPQAEMVLEAAQ